MTMSNASLKRTLKAAKRERARIEAKFDNRTRFNWGYHDAAQAVREGWDTIERNFGFGPALKLNTPSQVIAQHPDKAYAHGWLAGLKAARFSQYSGDSGDAFDLALADGLVEE